MPRHPYRPYIGKFGKSVFSGNSIRPDNGAYEGSMNTHKAEYKKDYSKSKFDHRFDTGKSRFIV